MNRFTQTATCLSNLLRAMHAGRKARRRDGG